MSRITPGHESGEDSGKERPAGPKISRSDPRIANSTPDQRPAQTRAWTLASDGVLTDGVFEIVALVEKHDAEKRR